MTLRAALAFSCMLLAGNCLAQPLPAGSTVAVMPLTYRYNVDQEYIRTVVETNAYLKGYFRENSSASSRSSYNDRDRFGMQGGSYSQSDSDSAQSRASGDYDLKAHNRMQAEAYYDRTIVEKTLDSSKLTGILESALSEAGIRVADRSQLRHLDGERARMKDKNFSPTQGQKGSGMRIADYLLNGQIESMRLEGVRQVPDGSGRRYAIGGVVKISVKLSGTTSGVSDFAKTITGKARKTFDANDPAPADEVIELAMDDVARQLTEALSGVRGRGDYESEDSEYQDSPGKRLRE